MKKIISITALFLVLTSCGDAVSPPDGYDCRRNEVGNCFSSMAFFKEVCDTENRAKFIIDCAKAANPMSDEEGEDLVVQCEKTSLTLFCKRTYLNQNQIVR